MTIDPNLTQHDSYHTDGTDAGARTACEGTVAHPPAADDFDDPRAGTATHAPFERFTPPERLLPVIPGYEVECELGRGAVGVVYKARQLRPDRVVALKVLLAGEHAGPKELARFRAEAETAAQVWHPNVLRVYDVGEHNGVSYIAAEYAAGGDLHRWMGGRPVPIPSAVKLVYTLARAVGAAHQKGIVHRDLKPQNVLVVDGVPKVADFGLAKAFGESGQTTTGAILGTPYYMSPEQAAGLSKRVGPPADVYSLGVMFYEFLAGRVPFAGRTVLDTLDQVRFAQPIPVQELCSDVPPALAVIVRRCLSKVPEERYRTADDLADDIARAANGLVSVPDDGPAFPAWLLPLVGTVAALVLGAVLLRGGKAAQSAPRPPSAPPAAATTPYKLPGANPDDLPAP